MSPDGVSALYAMPWQDIALLFFIAAQTLVPYGTIVSVPNGTIICVIMKSSCSDRLRTRQIEQNYD